MPLILSWQQIAIRLALAIITSGCIGLNRGERGRSAGFRTTILVCLAAAVAMLQANLLLGTVGKAPNSFVVLDLMRLPLGILSGIGFIGAGAILRKGDHVRGVTTAATLWFVTVMGLCFGGGQIGLGLASFALGFGTLWLLKYLEHWIRQDRQATLYLGFAAEKSSLSEAEIRAIILEQGFKIESCRITSERDTGSRTISYQVRWRSLYRETELPAIYGLLAARPEIERIEWLPEQ